MKFVNLFRVSVLVPLLAGCAYFNTFYNARVNYREGVRLKAQGQTGAAQQKFDKAIEKSALVITRYPRSRWVDDALFLIGRSYYEKNDFSRAINYFERLSLAFPSSPFLPEAELYRGLALLRDGRVGSGRVVLDGVRQGYPRLGEAAEYYLAVHALEQGETREGVDSLLAFLRRHPRTRFRPEATRRIAEGYLQLKNYAAAEEWLRSYAQLENEPRRRAEAQMKVAYCRLEQGKYDEAVRMAEEALGKYPDLDESLRLILGKGYLGMGRGEEALAQFVRVRGSNAAGAEAAFLIGRFYEENRDFARARVYYDSARLRRADSEEGVLATKRLALLAALEEDTLHPREPAEVKFLLAEVHNLNLEDYENALRLYQAVYDSFPASVWAPKALLARAWIFLYRKADTTACIEVLRKIVADYPAGEIAAEAQRWLERLRPGTEGR